MVNHLVKKIEDNIHWHTLNLCSFHFYCKIHVFGVVVFVPVWFSDDLYLVFNDLLQHRNISDILIKRIRHTHNFSMLKMA